MVKLSFRLFVELRYRYVNSLIEPPVPGTPKFSLLEKEIETGI